MTLLYNFMIWHIIIMLNLILKLRSKYDYYIFINRHKYFSDTLCTTNMYFLSFIKLDGKISLKINLQKTHKWIRQSIKYHNIFNSLKLNDVFLITPSSESDI